MFGELIMSRYVAESITMIAGHFAHEGLCQLRTELKKLQCAIGYIANTDQWCPAIIVVDSGTYLLTISSPDIDKVAMSLYDIMESSPL